MRRTRRRLETAASSSAIAAHVDGLQHQLGAGPCVEAVATGQVCLVDDVRNDHRWPAWSDGVTALGVGSVLCVPLAASAEPLGALTVCSRQEHAFDAEGLDVSVALAGVVGHLVQVREERDQLSVALQSRHTIGVAQGILMARYHLGVEGAFAVLRRLSADHNTKLRDVAAQVAAGGDLPDGATGDGRR
ncbi:GAF and ANTAR domain-containing protein [Nocardioides anomalus]|uniref:GAF and ANTAR domain-containing protein n=1 Tax=Nocardioides anomalus TaxID=2712223 RepID=UPI001E414D39|nr:GAF and ANTAR domain-containing protein [Nocardioides anomalus]